MAAAVRKPMWESVSDSTRIVAEAYFQGKILVRFPDGTEWWYRASRADWADFQSGSRGHYISTVLDNRANGHWSTK